MSWNHVKSTKTGEERKLRRKFQNYLFLFQTGKRKASLIFSCRTENMVFWAVRWCCDGLSGWDDISSGGETELGCCKLDALYKKVQIQHPTEYTHPTLSLWALILTQNSRTAAKTCGCGLILTCPCDPSSRRALLDFVTHNKALATAGGAGEEPGACRDQDPPAATRTGRCAGLSRRWFYRSCPGERNEGAR